jgi:hypothetical protein
MQAWICSSLVRNYPDTQPGNDQTLMLDAARGGHVSFQVAFRTSDKEKLVTATAESELDVTIRRVGYVPVPHLNAGIPESHLEGIGRVPGYVPDPLFPESTIHAGVWETHSFWVTVRISPDTPAGRHSVVVRLSAEGEDDATTAAQVNVHKAVLSPRRDFPITHWFYADALCDWYKVEPFDEGFWKIVKPYFANVASHGVDTVYVPMFTPPLDGNKRPTQLLHVTCDDGRYSFDWALVRRWVKTAEEQGIANFEWTHLFRQWGAKHPVRIYKGSGGGEEPFWPEETPAISPIYRDFLTQFLPEFKRFLDAEGLLDRSFFHISDEPGGEEALANYRAARQMVHELAPWMKILDALSELEFAQLGLVDTPVPVLTTALDFQAKGYDHSWCYYCTEPRGKFVNRRMDTPLSMIRMTGWLFYKTRVKGFLHWGYNYWYKSQTRQMIDPFTVSDADNWPHWTYGDPFVVYPGPDGPIDSIRWEVFAESLQDFALLQTSGIEPHDPMLSDVGAFDDFPFGERWIAETRKSLFSALDS